METTTKKHDQDFISAALEINRMEYRSVLLIPPTINHVFYKNEVNHAFYKNEELDNTIVHRKLTHALDEKVEKMTKLNIILDLPKRKAKRYKKQLQIYMLSKYSKSSQGSDHKYR